MLLTDAAHLGRVFNQQEENIDLGRAALLLARAEYPDLDVEAEITRLDRLAAEAAPSVNSQPDAPARLAALRFFLADLCGFRGNEQDYYDPKNSFLNEVLDRRTGIPITLSVIYMEVGRRLGLPLRGVGLPGHFLVCLEDPRSILFLDPFHNGHEVTADGCREMIARMYEGQIDFQQEFLAPVTKKYIVLRMLNNLRGIYLQQRQFRKALAIVEMVLAVAPASGDDLKQRGLLHYRLHNFRQSRLDLESYLFLKPDAPDADEVKQTLHELKRVSAMLN